MRASRSRCSTPTSPRAGTSSTIDTADIYAGGASETIVGDWMAARGNRDELIVATKVGMAGDGLTASAIRTHAEESLRKLRTDRIDLYYAHADDEATALEQSLGAFDALVRAGSVRYVAASNYSAERLAQALAISDRDGLARYVALQPHYNLLERGYETEHGAIVAREQLGVAPYFGLARGFLTGKYRPGGATVDSPRAQNAGAYLDARGIAVLAVLDDVAAAHDTTVAAVALAWLLAQPGIVAPIASARTTAQLAELLPMAELRLDDDELARLTAASEPTASSS